jgi:hypothetical protein
MVESLKKETATGEKNHTDIWCNDTQGRQGNATREGTRQNLDIEENLAHFFTQTASDNVESGKKKHQQLIGSQVLTRRTTYGLSIIASTIAGSMSMGTCRGAWAKTKHLLILTIPHVRTLYCTISGWI